MTERRSDRQGGLGAQGGQVREGWHYWVDPWTGRSYWARDANSLGEEQLLSDPYEGSYGNSPLAHLSSAGMSKGRHTKRNPSEE